MARVSEECREKSNPDDWQLVWIVVREQIKVRSPKLLSDWDAVKSDPGLASYELGAAVDAVMQEAWGPELRWPDRIDEALTGHLPGFHNEDCTMNFEEFTCFCGWLASLDPGAQQAVLARMSAGETPWETEGSPCPEGTATDVMYGHVKQKSPSWSTLAFVGLGIMSVLGIFWSRRK